MSTDINPNHYQFQMKGQTFEVADLMEAHFPTDMHLAQALKYMMRAGRKPTASYISDVNKCLWWCAKALMFRGAKHIATPPGAPITPEATTTPQKYTRKLKVKVHPGIKK